MRSFTASNDTLALAVRCKRVAGLDVLGGQVWEVLEYLGLRHSRSQVAEHVVYGDAHPSNARLSAAFARLNGYDVPVVHEITLAPSQLPSKGLMDAKSAGHQNACNRFSSSWWRLYFMTADDVRSVPAMISTALIFTGVLISRVGHQVRMGPFAIRFCERPPVTAPCARLGQHQ